MTPSDALSRLRAGLDRDEQIAQAAIKAELPLPIGWPDPQVAARWKYSEYEDAGRTRGQVQCLDMRIDRGAANEQKRHIAEQDPASTLRWVEAIRKVIAEHGRTSYGHCEVCRDYDFRYDYDPVPWPCPTIRALASIYPADETEGANP